MMKQIIPHWMIVLLSLFLIGAGGCTSSSGNDDDDDDADATTVTVSIADINDGTPVDAVLTIVGADAPFVGDSGGNSLLTTDSSSGVTVGRTEATNGSTVLSLVPGKVPTPDFPVRVLIQAEADGYVVNTASLVLTAPGAYTSDISLVNVSNPPAGITAASDNTGTASNGVVQSTVILETPFEDSAGQRVGRVVIRIPANTQLMVRKDGELQLASDGAFSATVVNFSSAGQGDTQSQALVPDGFVGGADTKTVGKFDVGSVGNFFSFVVKDSEGNKVQLFTPPIPVVTNVSPQVAELGDSLDLWMYDEGALTGEWNNTGTSPVETDDTDSLLVSFMLSVDVVGGAVRPGAPVLENQNLAGGPPVIPAATDTNTAGNVPTTSDVLPTGLTLLDIPGGTFTMGEPESTYEGPPGSYDATEHTVTLSNFQMSETEVTNQQYVEFLNSALAAGLVEVRTETNPGPDLGFTLVYGTSSAPSEYAGLGIYNLTGTRVLKDHDNADGDSNEFTGDVEAENPLNIAFIGYDATRTSGSEFYVKDPRDSADFDWQELTNYSDYTTVTNQTSSVVLNDYNAWPELADYPNNLPTQAEVSNYPATFIRWYGAKAFALYYNLSLPTEAQWEYACRGGNNHTYCTDDGAVDGDGTSAIWNHLLANPSQGHVFDVKINSPNPYGLYNMAGNVWEWMEDWYDASYYASSPTNDPVNTTDTGKKVRRGGAWNYHLATLKSASRFSDEQFKGNDHFGFRVVK